MSPAAGGPGAPGSGPRLDKLLRTTWSRLLEGGACEGRAKSLAQVMLVVAGVKPAAMSLRQGRSWTGIPSRTLSAALIDQGYVAGKVRVGREWVQVVAANESVYDELFDALGDWLSERDVMGVRGEGAARVGRLMGYPEEAVAAFVAHTEERPTMGDEEGPPRGASPELLVWWDAVRCFRMPNDFAAYLRCSEWCETAIDTLLGRFPGLRVPESTWQELPARPS